MKKLILGLFLIVLMSSMVFAITGRVVTEVSNPVSTQAQNRINEITQNREQFQEQITQDLDEMPLRQRNIYQNQNKVRIAVHALLGTENLTGGIGKEVSEIARDFNNSVQSTIRLEEQIQNRNRIARFFAGGDLEAGRNLEQEVLENQNRVQELKQLTEECDECGEEVKELMQQQIQEMEQEQGRLQALAQREKTSKGLFGWIWKR